MISYVTIRELYDLCQAGSDIEMDALEYVQVQGWIRNNRKGKNIGFLAINDGTYFRNAQGVYSSDLSNFEEISSYGNGTSVTMIGKFKVTPDGKQPFEIEVTEVVLEGACSSDYP